MTTKLTLVRLGKANDKTRATEEVGQFEPIPVSRWQVLGWTA